MAEYSWDDNTYNGVTTFSNTLATNPARASILSYTNDKINNDTFLDSVAKSTFIQKFSDIFVPHTTTEWQALAGETGFTVLEAARNTIASTATNAALYSGLKTVGKVLGGSAFTMAMYFVAEGAKQVPSTFANQEIAKGYTSTAVGIVVSGAVEAGIEAGALAGMPALAALAASPIGLVLISAVAAYAAGQLVAYYWDDITSGPYTTYTDVQNYITAHSAGVSTYLDNLFSSSNLMDNVAHFIDEMTDHGASTYKDVSQWMHDIQTHVGNALANGSPLVLDVDGVSGVQLSALGGIGTVYWDIDNDGVSEATGWVAGGDGLLCIDKNADGKITNNELFGNTSTASNGFIALGAYDTDGSGTITAADANFNDLRVWIDLNHDGDTQPNELKTLASLNITSINLAYSDVNLTNNGNAIKQQSTFIQGGVSKTIVDAWFSYSDTNTTSKTPFTLDPSVLTLPDIRGYGNILNLSVAASINNTGTSNLLSQLTAVSGKTFAQIFDGTTSYVDTVRTLMFKWAGVDAVVSTSRGLYIDARELAFIEKLTGQPFLQRGLYSNPGVWAAEEVKDAFNTALNSISARLAAQGAAKSLFTGAFHYDLTTDTFIGVTGVNSATLSSLSTSAASASNKVLFWQDVIRVIDNTVGVASLPAASQTALENAINGSSASLHLSDIVASLDYHSATGVTLSGTSFAETLTGGVGNDTISGGYGNDVLNGGVGNDKIYGEGDNDTINGQTGADYLFGGFGNDIYNYSYGDGEDTIQEQGTSATDLADKIVFGSGIALANLSMARVGNSDLVITISGTSAGKITIENFFNYTAGGGSVETIQFSGGSTYNLVGQAWTTNGTSGDDIIYGVISGGLTNDTIYGNAGNDKIYGDTGVDSLYGGDGNDYIQGDAGNDVIYGDNGDDTIYGGADDDTMYGGAGNDYIDGAAGNDTYWYVSGIDTVIDSAGTDVLKLDAVWNAVTPQYLRIGSDLQIFFDANNSVTIKNHWGAGGYVESLQYANGTIVNLTTVSYTAQGTSGNDTLTGNASDNAMFGLAGNDSMYGGDGNDIMHGGDGNDTMQGENGNDFIYGDAGTDTLYGYAGNDYLEGGAGDDYMQGGADNDTYMYTSGIDHIYDQSGVDILKIAAGYDLSDASFVRRIDATTNAYDLRVEFSPTNLVWIDDYFNGTLNAVETLIFADLTSITLNTLSYTVYGSASGETIYGVTVGGSTNDIMYGMGGDDTLNGDAGDDTMYGGAGNDTLYGGAGNDKYVFESGLDTFSDLTASTDTLKIMAPYTVNDISFSSTGSSDTKITMAAGIDEITVKNLRSTSQYWIETIEFSDGFKASLPTYATWTHGTAGNDTITGTASDDTIIGHAGNDTIDGAGGNDAIHGGDGNDILKGGAGTDLLHGGVGDDTLYGQDGLDTLFGGAGADTFVFEAVSAYNNIDVIKDFSLSGADKLNLANLLTSYNPLTHAIEDFVRITESGGNSLLAVDRDGTGTTYGFQQIATIEGVLGLTDEAGLKTSGQLITA